MTDYYLKLYKQLNKTKQKDGNHAKVPPQRGTLAEVQIIGLFLKINFKVRHS